MTEREWLEQQLASVIRQQAEAVATVQRCQGATVLIRQRLAMLDREEVKACQE